MQSKDISNHLLSKELLLSEVFNGLSDSVKILDLNGRIIEANKSSYKDLDIDALNELEGNNWFFIWADTDKEIVRAAFEKAKNGEKSSFQARRSSTDGELCWWKVKLSPIVDDNNNVSNIFVICTDVTETRKSNQALIESELRLSLATDSAEIGIWDWNLAEGVLIFSETQLRILGLDESKSVIGIEEFYKHIHDDDKKKLSLAIEKTLERDEKYKSTFRFIKPSSEIIYLKGIGQVIRDQNGEATRLIGVNIDITTQRETLSALKKAKFDASSAFRAKSDFVANISHEIRTPMNSILGYADLLTRKEISEHVRLDYANQIQKSGNHLLGLLNDVLDISKIEAGKFSIENKEINFSEIITECAKSLNVVAQRKGVNLNVDLDTSIPKTLFSDDLRIRQVLINLIGNAIKFTKEGFVNLRISYDKNTSTLGTINISVVDTGIGIAEDKIPGLFEPFTQSDASISRKFGGTGLGLHLSQKLADHLGGGITLEQSTLGEGSHFKFHFPVKISADVDFIDSLSIKSFETNSFTEVYSISDKKLRILLVEDSIENQRLIKIFLDAIDAQIDIAENGQEAIKYALDKEYDLIFMDIMMPVLDGLSATKKLRNAGYTKPIVALTAHAIRKEVEKCINAGCNSHLAKPVSQNELLKTVEFYS